MIADSQPPERGVEHLERARDERVVIRRSLDGVRLSSAPILTGLPRSARRSSSVVIANQKKASSARTDQAPDGAPRRCPARTRSPICTANKFRAACITAIGEQETRDLIDGGLFANNPLLRAYLEARELCPQPDCRPSSNASEFEAVAGAGTAEPAERCHHRDDHALHRLAAAHRAAFFAAVARGSRRFAPGPTKTPLHRAGD
jgi:hypothetical protein